MRDSKTLIEPIKYKDQSGKPYVANSSFIVIASPPLYVVGLLNLINQTFKIDNEMMRLIILI